MPFKKTCYRMFCSMVVGLTATTTMAQSPSDDTAYKQFDISSVYRSFNVTNGADGQASYQLADPWWNSHVAQQQRDELQAVPTDIHSLMYLAVKYSRQIRIAAQNPLIAETAITEADSNFDWVKFLNASWNDTSEPVSNSLTVGGGGDRFNDHVFQLEGGLRRNTRTGGTFDISQRFGFQDNNSDFFIPADQATGQLTISYNQPLLRGRGRAFNNSLVVLAQLDAGIAHDQFKSELQDHLLEVARAYYALYQERASLAQQVRLYLKTQEIVRILKARQAFDAQRTQYVLASSALAARQADLIRAKTAVVNAETRLRGLINAPELSLSDEVELVPQEFPIQHYVPTELRSELQAALHHRPEVFAAIKEVKAGSTRLGVAQNELLPALNLVTQGFVSGLQGDTDFGTAFTDQFSQGAPSYSIGLQYELPVGNRLARARACRRQIELKQLQAQYEQALAAIETEVDIAVRELNTSWREINARSRTLAAAETEAKTIELRWSRQMDGTGSTGLNLESLLRAMERVTQAEQEYVTSMLTYNLSIINLKRANGTLLTSENVIIGRDGNGCDGEGLVLDKGQPIDQVQAHPQTQLIDGDPVFQPSVLQPTVGQPTIIEHSQRKPTPLTSEGRQTYEPTRLAKFDVPASASTQEVGTAAKTGKYYVKPPGRSAHSPAVGGKYR